MPISAIHSEAARDNGRLSKGPVSDQGKARSSQNARKHNLLGAISLLSCEDQAAFDALAQAFLNEHQPETPTEIRFVREMIDAEFRLQRVRSHAASIQQARMNKISESPDLDTAAEAFRQLAEEGPSLSLILRYENQFRRQFDKSLQMLLDFRLRERTDKDKIKRAQAEAYVEFTKDLVDLPMPGEQDPQEPATPASQASHAAKSNHINSPKEPSITASTSAQDPQKNLASRLLGQYFGNFGRCQA
jgi:hypothetical protein